MCARVRVVTVRNTNLSKFHNNYRRFFAADFLLTAAMSTRSDAIKTWRVDLLRKAGTDNKSYTHCGGLHRARSCVNIGSSSCRVIRRSIHFNSATWFSFNTNFDFHPKTSSRFYFCEVSMIKGTKLIIARNSDNLMLFF